jgi:hypothetical protein
MKEQINVMTREAKLVIVILSVYFGLLAFYAVPILKELRDFSQRKSIGKEEEK